MKFMLLTIATICTLLIHSVSSMANLRMAKDQENELTLKQEQFLTLVITSLPEVPAEDTSTKFCFSELVNVKVQEVPDESDTANSIIDLAMRGCYGMDTGKCSKNCKRPEFITKKYELHYSKKAVANLAERVQKERQRRKKHPLWYRILKGLGILNMVSMISASALGVAIAARISRGVTWATVVAKALF